LTSASSAWTDVSSLSDRQPALAAVVMPEHLRAMPPLCPALTHRHGLPYPEMSVPMHSFLTVVCIGGITYEKVISHALHHPSSDGAPVIFQPSPYLCRERHRLAGRTALFSRLDCALAPDVARHQRARGNGPFHLGSSKCWHRTGNPAARSTAGHHCP